LLEIVVEEKDEDKLKLMQQLEQWVQGLIEQF
jgi:hypothetical protein